MYHSRGLLLKVFSFNRLEVEKQRVLEWEEKRKKELNEHRQREQEKLLALKARQTNLSGDLEKLTKNQ